jgi:RHS repeat-associated protein
VFTDAATDNRLGGIDRNLVPFRDFTSDEAGNVLTDAQGGVTTAYSYSDANRLAAFTRAGLATGAYSYNALGQVVIRVVSNAANAGTTVYFYDQAGHVIAEYDGVSGALRREYIWLGDMPLAIIDPGTPSSKYYVHADHLDRPIAMTDATKAFVAKFTWRAYGELFAYTGTVGLDLRFPGQMFQAESGLYYNWFRQYDPTTGRYTQPDPLGVADGPSRYAYVGNDPLQQVDPNGLTVGFTPLPPNSPSGLQPPRQDTICIAMNDDCDKEIRACEVICSRARVDFDMPNIYGGTFQKCMRGCVSELCGGNLY